MLSYQNTNIRHRISRRRASSSRRGVTLVEFAIVFPIVLTMLFSGIVCFGLVMIQNTLITAASEGGRRASLSHVMTDESVISAVEDRLRRGGLNPDAVSIEIDPATLGSLSAGDTVSVSVSMAMKDSFWPNFGGSLSEVNLRSKITYTRE